MGSEMGSDREARRGVINDGRRRESHYGLPEVKISHITESDIVALTSRGQQREGRVEGRAVRGCGHFPFGVDFLDPIKFWALLVSLVA